MKSGRPRACAGRRRTSPAQNAGMGATAMRSRAAAEPEVCRQRARGGRLGLDTPPMRKRYQYQRSACGPSTSTCSECAHSRRRDRRALARARCAKCGFRGHQPVDRQVELGHAAAVERIGRDARPRHRADPPTPDRPTPRRAKTDAQWRNFDCVPGCVPAAGVGTMPASAAIACSQRRRVGSRLKRPDFVRNGLEPGHDTGACGPEQRPQAGARSIVSQDCAFMARVLHAVCTRYREFALRTAKKHQGASLRTPPTILQCCDCASGVAYFARLIVNLPNEMPQFDTLARAGERKRNSSLGRRPGQSARQRRRRHWHRPVRRSRTKSDTLLTSGGALPLPLSYLGLARRSKPPPLATMVTG